MRINTYEEFITFLKENNLYEEYEEDHGYGGFTNTIIEGYKVAWSVGYGYKNMYTPSSGIEPDYEKLDLLLEKIAPKITFLNYKKLLKKCSKYKTKSHSGYYGDWSYTNIKVINFDDLYNTLKEMKII